MGILLFIATYGIKVLDLTYDGWINMVQDPDIHQHYLGWCHFRKSPWSFPPGLIYSLSYPFRVSVLWTDSIPLFAFIFKCLDPVLPETFQYFGLYGLLSFALTGGTSALLIYRLTSRKDAALMAVPFFTESFPMLQRMFYHTSLTAHYLILIPLLFWLYDSRKWSLRKKCLLWGGYFLVAVLIHPYLWLMGGIIAVFTFIEEIVLTKDPRPALLTGLVSACLTLGALYLTGAFYGEVRASYKPGGFESNLNTFINPLKYSRILPPLPLFSPNQYEGFAYLGIGGIILFAIALALLLLNVKGRRSILCNRRGLLFTIMAGVFLLMSVITDISLNTRLIFRVSLPSVLENFFGIFRSTGRFIWPVMILILMFTFRMLFTPEKGEGPVKRILPDLLVLILLAAQIFEMSSVLQTKYERFNREPKEWHSDLENEALTSQLPNYRHIVLVTNDQYITDRTAYFAYRNGLTLNRFYFARNMDDRIEEKLNEYHTQCTEGEPPLDVIFVFDEGSFEEWKKDTTLHFYDLTGTIVGLAGELDHPEL